METQETLSPKQKKILHYALLPIYAIVGWFLDMTGEWWQKLLD